MRLAVLPCVFVVGVLASCVPPDEAPKALIHGPPDDPGLERLIPEKRRIVVQVLNDPMVAWIADLRPDGSLGESRWISHPGSKLLAGTAHWAEWNGRILWFDCCAEIVGGEGLGTKVFGHLLDSGEYSESPEGLPIGPVGWIKRNHILQIEQISPASPAVVVRELVLGQDGEIRPRVVHRYYFDEAKPLAWNAFSNLDRSVIVALSLGSRSAVVLRWSERLGEYSVRKIPEQVLDGYSGIFSSRLGAGQLRIGKRKLLAIGEGGVDVLQLTERDVDLLFSVEIPGSIAGGAIVPGDKFALLNVRANRNGPQEWRYFRLDLDTADLQEFEGVVSTSRVMRIVEISGGFRIVTGQVSRRTADSFGVQFFDIDSEGESVIRVGEWAVKGEPLLSRDAAFWGFGEFEASG